MTTHRDDQNVIADDERTLHRMGYAQELARRMHGFSNFAISLSIICILAGCITSFHIGFCSVGGASIGLGWPLVCLFSLTVAATMAQVASAFPTAGGLYHWASILGGKGWGWATAWFNLAGLVTVLAAINVGTFQFIAGAFAPELLENEWAQLVGVMLITFSQAMFNHLGIRVTAILTDISGFVIFIVTAALTITLLASASTFEVERLWTFTNYSGLPEKDPVWPVHACIPCLFVLGFLLPAYTVSGFDASAHASEETIGAAHNVPRGIVRSVLVSGVLGWIMLCAIVLAMPNLDDAAKEGSQAFFWTVNGVVAKNVALILYAGIAVAQYLCGLATVTSGSRMAFAFARDGGTPLGHSLRRVSPRFQSPSVAIWTVAVAAVAFTVYTPAYLTITAVCTILLYISYVLPTALGLLAYGRTWTRFGPWQLGGWYRPLAVVCILGCVLLIGIGMQPPNEKAAYVVGGMVVVLTAWWWLRARHIFHGPPKMKELLEGKPVHE